MKILIACAFLAVFASTSALKCFPVPNQGLCKASEHEVYTRCGAHPDCSPSCEIPAGPFFCPKICVEGCICEKGYVKNAEGKCVRPDECPERPPPVCAANEDWSDCGAHGCLNTCAEPNLITYCDPAPGCYPGCVCKEGFLRDAEGNCIDQSTCPPIKPVCPANEEYSECGAYCPRRCGPPTPCAAPDQDCYPGCVCVAGYVRGDDGSCIREEECPPLCARNMEYSFCGSACPLTCENPTGEDVVCTEQCVEGCFCKSGYVLDGNNICIPAEECPSESYCSTLEHQHYEACSSWCDDLTCYEREPSFCRRKCWPRCFCDEGYFRDINGNCIPECDCPDACNANQEYSDCVHPCPQFCHDPAIAYGCPAPEGCTAGCVCKEGYILNEEKSECIAPSECKWYSCGANEEYGDCGASPCQDTCANPTLSQVCKAACVPGCGCKEGFLRDDFGNCVEPSACPIQPTCALAFEEYTDCGTACPLTCENKDNPPMFCTANCVVGCACQSGYARDYDGNCILPEACPAPEPVCKTNEEYSECGANGCQNTCANPTLGQVCRGICTAGCVCQEGFLRDDFGNCIEASACPVQPTCALAFEEYTTCGTACPDTCENKDDGPRPCPAVCVEGCFCQSGYVRDSQGNCITPKNCPAPEPVCGANQEYSECGANSCQRTCSNVIAFETGKMACRPACNAGCICKEGYLKDDNGVCVERSACPAVQPTCALAFEEYTDCGTACPTTCANKDDGPRPCTKQCVQGCFCQKGYVRDSQRNCVAPVDCPKAVPAICLLPQETGPCKAAFKKWGYNPETGCCTEFTYGGCQGNDNRFDSEEECNSACL